MSEQDASPVPFVPGRGRHRFAADGSADEPVPEPAGGSARSAPHAALSDAERTGAAVGPDHAGSPDGGSPDGGSPDAGSPDAGSTEYGSTESGSTESGWTESPSTESGSTESGWTEYGSTESGDPAGDEPAGRHSDSVVSDSVVSDSVVSDSVVSDSVVTGPARTSRAGRNLPAAIAVGLGLAGLVVASLLIDRVSFVVIVGLAVAYGTYELCTAIATIEARPPLAPLVVGGVAMLVAAWARGPSGLVVALFITVAGVFVWRLADGAEGYLRDVSAAVLITLYLPLLAGFAVLLAHPSDGAARVIAFVAVVVCSDTGGYATGVLFGRHPLAPMVSKGKTWEGAVGSLIACLVCGSLLMTLTFHHVWWKGAVFGLAMVFAATLGDLGESMIKRDLVLKDMGRLLPGHGGLMDRLDSMLPCAAIAYLAFAAFLDH